MIYFRIFTIALASVFMAIVFYGDMPTITSLLAGQHLDRYYQIIKQSHVTEKATTDTHLRNAYHFRVPTDANKIEIRHAIETLFEVKVESVNTAGVKGKVRRRGYVKGQKPDWKKAMVTLKEGDTIDVI